MIFSSLFSKSIEKNIEKKYYSNNGSLLYQCDNIFNYSNNSSKFLDYYSQTCPVFSPIKLITDNLLSIEPVLKKTKVDRKGNTTTEFIHKHPVLDLLKKPNEFMDFRLLLKSFASYFILTGNSYLEVVTSFTGGKPIALNVLRPQDINIQADPRDGYASEYTYNSSQIANIYKRDRKKGNVIFLDKNDNQLAQLRTFNPNYSNNNLLGQSDLAACEIEVSQYMLASIHNNSLLKNQARPSGLLTFKGNETLDQEGIDAVKNTIKSAFSGAANAGKTAILSGDFDWRQMSESIKDMDFGTLKVQTEQAVYKALKIPLTFATEESSTMNNKEIAKLDLYDNVIIPLANIIYGFWNDILLPHYPNSDNLELTFDEAAIEILQGREVDNALKLSQSGVLTINEIRDQLGYEAISEGGDALYQPMNMVPVGTDQFTEDNRQKPASDKALSKAEYLKAMTSQKTIDGKPMFSEEMIKDNLKKYYE